MVQNGPWILLGMVQILGEQKNKIKQKQRKQTLEITFMRNTKTHFNRGLDGETWLNCPSSPPNDPINQGTEVNNLFPYVAKCSVSI